MQWKPIEGFNGYEVADAGEVKTLKQGANRNLKPGTQSKGFRTVSLYDGSKPKKPKSFLVSLLVAEAFLPPRTPEQTNVVHLDGDKKNDAATNLKWMTPAEARAYQIKNGIVDLTGANNGNFKGGKK